MGMRMPDYHRQPSTNYEATFGIRMKSVLAAVIRGIWTLLTLSLLDQPQRCLSSGFHLTEAKEFEEDFLVCTVQSN